MCVCVCVCVCVCMIMSKVWEDADYELGDIRLMSPPPCLMKPTKFWFKFQPNSTPSDVMTVSGETPFCSLTAFQHFRGKGRVVDRQSC